MNMILSVIITFLFPLVVDAIGINNTFLFFSGMMLIGAIYCWFDLIETKNKEKEQILIEMKVLSKVTPGLERENESLQNNEENDVESKKSIVQNKNIAQDIGPDIATNN